MPATPFASPDTVAPLYATAARLAQRTGALHTAKISGEDATTTITDLAAEVARPRPVVWDIGCGRGTTTMALAARLGPRQLTAVDASPTLLAVTRDRAAAAGYPVDTICADFHHLPEPDRDLELAVAAFCLYHSSHPEQVVAEITRCLRPGGHAVLTTKSADSYREIDHLMADAGLDTEAATRPSLYETFHSDTAPEITATSLRVARVLHQRHVFRFTGLNHLATYLVTSPKYQLPAHLHEATALANELRRRVQDKPVTTTSTVTYITAGRPR